MQELIEGYRRFRASGWAGERDRWAALQDGQAPGVMVIACSDSRVDPSQIFDTRPGEMFTVRNVAAMVPPFEQGGGHHGVSAAIEFAVTQLNIPEIVVMGHGACGGVNAALTRRFAEAPRGEGGLVADWMSLLDEARDRVLATGMDEPELSREMERESVRVSLANLRTFPFVAERERDGRLTLRGALFSIADGGLYLLDDATDRFVPA